MTMEGPVISAIINRLPDEVIMLAAMGIVSSLSVTIESPIINLLATSTAKAKDRPAYLLLQRFTIHWMIILTIITVLLAFTPLFKVVIIDLMNVPLDVALWVRPGLRIMTFWSAAIAWRRFLQGIMIRYNQTRKVAWGTVVRLIASGGTVIILAKATDWSGVIVGSSALMAGVLAEAFYATLATRPIVRNQLGPDSPLAEGPALTYKHLFWFHLPLAATSLLTLLVQPLVAFSLARSANPTLSLAAWPVVFQFTLVSRAAAFALPEVVIALYSGKQTFHALGRFTLMLVLISTVFMIVVVLTPIVNYYLFVVQDLTLVVAEIARSGLVMLLPLPALATLISWIRGLMIHVGATRYVNNGMVINLIVTAAVLLLGVSQHWPGINSASIALVVAAAAEFLYLRWRVGGILGFRYSVMAFRKAPVPS